MNSLSVVTVSYNSPELVRELLTSFRKFYNNPVYVIDGSEPRQFAEIESVVSAFADVKLIGFGYNIHHGPGMAWAIQNLPLTGQVLFLDSDVTVVNGGMIESLSADLQPGMYGVGDVQLVDGNGINVAESEGAIRYLHPACMLCNIDVMRVWPMPVKHGAPMLETMRAIKAAGRDDLIGAVDWVKRDFSPGSDKTYLVHDWRGTVSRTGGYHLDAVPTGKTVQGERPDYSTDLESYNRELLALIPPAAGKLIEVGCNVGALAAAFRRQQPGCDYRGVEIDAAAAELARSQCSTVWQLDVESVGDDFFSLQADRDCWIFGDVLEHLKNPWRLLSRIRAVIPPDGCVVACIPNAQHWMLQAKLAIGDFRYENGGLLDRTHLRWFTRATIFELFQSAGFRVAEGRPRIFDEPAREKVLPVIRMMAEAVGANGDLAVQDSLALQYVVRAVPA